MDLVGTKNAGYKIIRQGKCAVIGQSSEGMFVAWSYKIENGKADYFWGRYSDDIQEVTKRFDQKERGEYSGD